MIQNCVIKVLYQYKQDMEWSGTVDTWRNGTNLIPGIQYFPDEYIKTYCKRFVLSELVQFYFVCIHYNILSNPNFFYTQIKETLGKNALKIHIINPTTVLRLKLYFTHSLS